MLFAVGDRSDPEATVPGVAGAGGRCGRVSPITTAFVWYDWICATSVGPVY
ncbi:hypothetical protein GCM10022214_31540 [Actinomadura miaoliensis]|uniref:Uncharacterized protein n=1 Tax=Actinomadura miaoliensis TaxID=430685 RepID=A0ABP7VRG8_9ACTN